MTIANARFLAALVFFSFGCQEFPEVPANTCGNGVIETDVEGIANEYCDTHDLFGVTCRKPGTVGECNLDCSVRDGKRSPCPSGWGCDLNDICRPPTGTYAPVADSTLVRSYEIGVGQSLYSGDFDADGRADVMSMGVRDRAGRSHLRFLYFDQNAELSETYIFPKTVNPVVTRLQTRTEAADPLSDVVFNDDGIGTLLGRKDRRLVPESYSSVRIPNASILTYSLYDQLIKYASPMVFVTVLDDVPGFYVAEPTSFQGETPSTGALSLKGTLYALPDASSIATGDIIEGALSPCRELVLLAQDGLSFTLVDACTLDSNGKDVIWRDQVLQTQIAILDTSGLEFEAQRPVVGDVNGDSHLDVLFYVAGKAYVSLGDGVTLKPAIPFRIRPDDPEQAEIELPSAPLAVGDFTGDGKPDFVLPTQLLVSLANTTSEYMPVYANPGAPWSRASIADINANGHLDVVAISDSGFSVALFLGSSTRNLVPHAIPTNGATTDLAIADFDGDLVTDIAFIESAPLTDAQRKDVLRVAFGNPSGLPNEPITIARIANVEQVTAVTQQGMAGLFVASKGLNPPLTEQGLLTLFIPSADRIPHAPYTLLSFEKDGSQLVQTQAIGIASGSFRTAGESDVLALAQTESTDAQFWLIPELITGKGAPRQLNASLPASFEAVVATLNELPTSTLSAAALDTDNNGRDEAVWVMRAKGAGCGVLLSELAADESSLLVRDSFILDMPCERPKLQVLDADEDGYRDIALLLGSFDRGNTTPGEPYQWLYVLWNDGTGHYSAQNAAPLVTVTDLALGISDFTALKALRPQRSPGDLRGQTTTNPRTIAYLTQTGVRFLRRTEARNFSDELPLDNPFAFDYGLAIVAADVDGDGIEDLAIQNGNALNIFKARLEEGAIPSGSVVKIFNARPEVGF